MDQELQQNWNKINQQRAAFYGWFAGAFSTDIQTSF
ncbi:molecular chaperone TorD [Oligella ureolytica]